LNRVCRDLLPQRELESILSEMRLQVIPQCGLEFWPIVGAREAQNQLDAHNLALECDGLHSLGLPQGLGEIRLGIRANFFAENAIRGSDVIHDSGDCTAGG
jgi:hypothetical protein